MSEVKYYVHVDWNDMSIVYAKNIASIQSIENYDISLYGIIETIEGDVLFNIEWNYYGELIIMKKFMHLESFLKYSRFQKKRFLDKHSERYITKYLGCD